MDTESKTVVRFLEALQVSREKLIQGLHNPLILKGASSATPFLVLSGNPFKIHDADFVREFSGAFAIGINAKLKSGEEIEFGTDILWSESGWLITTEIYARLDDGQKLLR